MPHQRREFWCPKVPGAELNAVLDAYPRAKGGRPILDVHDLATGKTWTLPEHTSLCNVVVKAMSRRVLEPGFCIWIRYNGLVPSVNPRYRAMRDYMVRIWDRDGSLIESKLSNLASQYVAVPVEVSQ